MPKTNAEIISEIKNDIKALNIDQHISGRFILSKAKDIVQDILNKVELSELLKDDSFFSEIQCFEMTPIKSYKCDIVEFRSCENIMKSKEKLPDLYKAKIGSLILNVYNIDGSVEYRRLRNLADFRRTNTRQYGKLFKYYYVMDNYLYLLNSTAKVVNVIGIFEEEIDDNDDSLDGGNKCKSTLQKEFKCPDKYLSIVKRGVLNDIANINVRMVVDENPDGDENQKSKKVN